MQRGEVYFVCLDPVFGRELGGFKLRPVVIVTINDINEKRMPVVVVPGTTKERKQTAASKHTVEVARDAQNGLSDTTYFQCHQIRAIDQGRMVARPIGTLAAEDFERIKRAISLCLGLP